jgi:hypothetical protein
VRVPLSSLSPGPAELPVPSHCGLVRSDFTFTDLRFLKPSRMAPVYIAFACVLRATGGKRAGLSLLLHFHLQHVRITVAVKC